MPRNDNSHRFESFAFDVDKFNQLLNGNQAQNLLYLQSRLCPCRDRSTGAPSRSCVRCRGFGYTYSAPEVHTYSEVFYYGSETRPAKLTYPHTRDCEIVSVESESQAYYDVWLDNGVMTFGASKPSYGDMFMVTYRAPLCVRALVTSVRDSRQVRQDLGITEQGSFALTFPSMLELPGDDDPIPNPAFFATEPDKFVLLDSHIQRQDILYKGEQDRLLYGYVHTVLECYRVTPDGFETHYSLGSDYSLEAGKLIWQHNDIPDGTPYAVRYLAAPEYYIHQEQPQVRHQGQKDLPRRVNVKLWSTHPRIEQTGIHQ